LKRVAAKLPSSFAWAGREYDMTPVGSIVVWDDPDVAEEIAAHLGVKAKHAPNKFKQDEKYWKTISVIVPKSSR
jgi:hypothetical protein